MTSAAEEGPGDRLELDALTLEDLGVFTASEGGTSLFEFCDRTRTRGGSRALARRLRSPFAEPARIQRTQASVRFALGSEAVFADLPSAYATLGVERYLRSPVPRLTQEHGLEFAMAAAWFWFDDLRQYSTLAHGVEMTCRFLHLLREMVARARAAEPEGDLAEHVAALDALLGEAALSAVPSLPPRGRPYRLLRLDQLFRVRRRGALEEILGHFHEIDALLALARTTREEALALPEVVEGPLRIEAEALVHPLLGEAVANPVDLGPGRGLLFLTGPNMAGKTTYLRAVATALVLAQLGMGVPARRFRFAPAEQLFTSISLRDDLHGGVSYFRAEALRVKAVAEAVAAGARVVAVMDEPFKGTNVKDAFDASEAVLTRFARTSGLFLFTSHLIELEAAFRRCENIDFRYFEADVDGGRLAFDFRLREGVSAQRLGMRVLEEEGVFGLLDAPQGGASKA